MAAAAATADNETSSTSPCEAPDVFLSFKGGDTRKTFTDHLYTALVRIGIRTFRDDDDDAARGEDIETEMQKAIESSKAAVIVFSGDYASSPMCLDELATIMDRRRSDGLVVIPVFYDVDPDEVSEQSGGYGQAFAVHTKQFAVERVGRWREALRDVTNLAGMVLESRHEAPFIQDIVREVNRRLNRKLLHVTPYLVGVESHVERIGSWLQSESSDVKTTVIYGVGGIGKTTVAKLLYNLHYNDFERSSFLADINRKTLEQSTGLLSLQRQLLSDIQRGKFSRINNEDEGILKIRDAIRSKRVLIVLDDVDQLEQFNTILGMQNWLYPGSKMIVTTRDASLLSAREGCEMVKIEAMDDNASLELFSLHAFGKNHPDEGYLQLSESAVKYCGGLPLALEVLGSYFFDKRDVDIWESALKEIQEVSHPKIQKILKMSYDSLLNDSRRELFLDIACFFVGMQKDYVATIADGCGYHSKVAIQELIDKCLVAIDEDKMLTMHQLVRDMGRRIVHEESPEAGKRTRIWDHNDAFQVLSEPSGSESIEGLSLNWLKLQQDKSEPSYERYRKRRRSGFFSWLPGYGNQPNMSPVESLAAEGFANMQRLKLLQLSYVKLRGDYKTISKSLVWLYWQGYSSDCIPNDLCLDNLVVLDIQNSSLKRLWNGSQYLTKLRILNLSHSLSLVKSPDFNELPGLERLILEGCLNLVVIDPSIGELLRIVFISLKDCRRLRELPKSISKLQSLKELDLSGCIQLGAATSDFDCEDGISTNQMQVVAKDRRKSSLLSAASVLSILGGFSPIRRPTPTLPPFTFFLPRFLSILRLANCNISDDYIPPVLTQLPSLATLDLSLNPIRTIPESITFLTSLELLVLKECERLQHLPALPASLTYLGLTSCKSLERIGRLPHLSKSFYFYADLCENLVEMEGYFKLEPMGDMDREMINRIGLLNMESTIAFEGGGVEVEMVNAFTRTSRRGTPRVLREFGIFTLFASGSEIPDWYDYQAEGDYLSIEVPSSVANQKIIGLNFCAVYKRSTLDDHEDNKFVFPCVMINNITTDIIWGYRPTIYEIPSDELEEKRWLSHMSFGKQFESGDQVTFRFFYGEEAKFYQVKRIGVYLVREEAEEGEGSGSGRASVQSITASPWYQVLADTDLSPYETEPGEFNLDYDWLNDDCSEKFLLNGRAHEKSL